ncbi:MAG: hypothetical protein EPO07_11420 [Verrucomicrobia bacterium]|nr:MAG: hypothetical protein EPO07_11420 [Verrucomicrobiota bacterium]
MKTLKTLLVLIALVALAGLTGFTIHTYQEITKYQLHPWEVQMAQLYGNDWYTKHSWYSQTNRALYYELRMTQYRLMVADPTLVTPAPNWVGWRYLTNHDVTLAANAD